MVGRGRSPNLNVEAAGGLSSPAMLLIHGFLSSNAQWAPNRDALAAHLRLIMVELPGHGDSPVPDDDAAYEPAAIVAAIDAIREQLGIDRWWVTGQSLGGAIAVRYALGHTDRVCGLTFTNSRAVFGVEEGRAGGDRSQPPPFPSDP